MDLLWLSESDVRSLLTVRDAIPLVEDAFASVARGEARMPPKIYLDFKEFGGDLRAMPAYLPKSAAGKPFAGVKVVTVHPGNPAKGLPTVSAVFVLNDPETGLPLALMGAGALTDIRTGAAGGVAAKHMARKDSRVVGLVGCGRQAVTQLQALLALFSVDAVKVAGKTREDAERFCRETSAIIGKSVKMTPCDVREACEADIVVTTTPARAPVVMDGWVRPGTHITAVGADAPGKQEIESSLLARALVIVDKKEQAVHSGEVNVPLATGALKPEGIAGELGNVILGKLPGRTSPEEITLFDSTGLAVQDVAVGAWVYLSAKKNNAGVRLAL